MGNHLKQQGNLYLLQHSHNPVDWYPWCGEAFQKAAKENKPVFLSVGYSICHWCHVMAHEGFDRKNGGFGSAPNFVERYWILWYTIRCGV